MRTIILGIDPGVTGAYAALSDGVIALGDLPVMRDGKLAWIDAEALTSSLLALKPANLIAVVERVHAMPKNGVVGAFSQGCTFGSILGALQIVRARIELVTPQTWKRGLGLISERKLTDIERKRASLDRARMLFPEASLDRAKDHGRAEALLIAHWYIRSSTRAEVA